MKLNRVEIDGYGQFSNIVIDRFDKPITLIYGPNEAGKSTVHSFIKAGMFGYPSHSANVYEPLTGGHVGGALEFTNEKGDHIRISRHTPPKKGKVKLYIKQQECDENELKKVFGHLTPKLFESIFCFNHIELQQLDIMKDDELATHLFTTAMGGNVQAFIKSEQIFMKKKDELFRPRASKPVLNHKVKQLEQLNQELQYLKLQEEKYVPLQLELKQNEQSLNELKEHRLNLEHKLAENQKLTQINRLTQSMDQLLHEKKSYPDLKVMPYEADFQKLSSEYEKKNELEASIQRIETERQRRAKNLSHGLTILGEGWTLEQLANNEWSLVEQDAILQLADAYTDKQHTLEQSVAEMQQVEQALERLQHRLADEQRVVKEQLNKERDETNLQKELSRSSSNQSMYVFSAIALGGTVAWLLFNEPLLAVLHLFIFSAVTIWQYQQKRKDNRRLMEQGEKLAHERERLATQFNNRLYTLQNDIDNLQYRKNQLQNDIEHIEAQCQNIKEAYENNLAHKGLPKHISEQSIKRLLHTIDSLQKEYKQWQVLSAEKKEAQKKVNAWNEAVLQLYHSIFIDKKAHAKFASGGTTYGDTTHGDIMHDETVLVHSVHDGNGHREIAHVGTEVDLSADVAYQMLLKAYSNEKKLEQQKQTIDIQYKQLDNQRSALLNDIHLLKDESDLHEKKMDVLIEERETLEKQLQAVNDDIEKKATYIGHLQSQIKELENEEKLITLTQQYEEKLAEFQSIAKQWVSYAIATRMYDETKKMYEVERQPNTLKVAAQFFQKMTLGRYVQITAPFGEKHINVVRDDGVRLTPAYLSQGTKEQLYLALRFAFVKQYAEHVKLPLIMDDIFVNFDKVRLGEALRGLEQMCSSHQVIIFTCHEHIKEQFVQKLNQKVGVLSLTKMSGITSY